MNKKTICDQPYYSPKKLSISLCLIILLIHCSDPAKEYNKKKISHLPSSVSINKLSSLTNIIGLGLLSQVTYSQSTLPTIYQYYYNETLLPEDMILQNDDTFILSGRSEGSEPIDNFLKSNPFISYIQKDDFSSETYLIEASKWGVISDLYQYNASHYFAVGGVRNLDGVGMNGELLLASISDKSLNWAITTYRPSSTIGGTGLSMGGVEMDVKDDIIHVVVRDQEVSKFYISNYRADIYGNFISMNSTEYSNGGIFPESIQILSDGRKVVCGDTQRDGNDMLFIVYDSDDFIEYGFTLGTPGDEECVGILVDNDDNIFFGGSNRDSFINGVNTVIFGMLDSTLNPVFITTVGSIGEDNIVTVQSLDRDNNDIYYITGVAESIDMGSDHDDALAISFNKDGEYLGLKYFGGPESEEAFSIISDLNDDLFILGDTTSFGSTQQALFVGDFPIDGINSTCGNTNIPVVIDVTNNMTVTNITSDLGPGSVNFVTEPYNTTLIRVNLTQEIICEETLDPTNAPSESPSISPSLSPTLLPTYSPTHAPTVPPSNSPSLYPTFSPSDSPSTPPTDAPTDSPTLPSTSPTNAPTVPPSNSPSLYPTFSPSDSPSTPPTNAPTDSPTLPSTSPTNAPTNPPTAPSTSPSTTPTFTPTMSPTNAPSNPTVNPTPFPTNSPTRPTKSPTPAPTNNPTRPTKGPTPAPTNSPTHDPTISPSPPSMSPTEAPTISPSVEGKSSDEPLSTGAILGITISLGVLLILLLCCCAVLAYLRVVYLKTKKRASIPLVDYISTKKANSIYETTA